MAQTSVIELIPIDKGNRLKLNTGKIVVGRTPDVGCIDKKISRNHAEIILKNDGNLFIKPIHHNPVFFKTKNNKVVSLTKDKEHQLFHDDQFGLLPDNYFYRVNIIVANSHDNKTDDSSFSHETDANITNPMDISDSRPHEDNPKSPILGAVNESDITNEKQDGCNKSLIIGAVNESDINEKQDDCNKSPILGAHSARFFDNNNPSLDESPPVTKSSPKKRYHRLSDDEDEMDQTKNLSLVKNEIDSPQKQTIGNTIHNHTTSNDDEKKSSDVERKPIKQDISASNENSGVIYNTPRTLPSWMSSSEPPPSSKTKAKPKTTVPRTKTQPPKTSRKSKEITYDDGDSDEQVAKNEDVKESKQPVVVTTKQSSQNGTPGILNFYLYQSPRTNPLHRQQVSHPGDSDYEMGSDNNNNTNTADNKQKPLCPYGSDCYRKNAAHFKEFRHNSTKTRTSATGRTSKRKSIDEEDLDEPNEYDFDDSFIDDQGISQDSNGRDRHIDSSSDSEDEWKPSDKAKGQESDSDVDDDDVETLKKEAAAFLKNKKLQYPHASSSTQKTSHHVVKDEDED
ncbi:unnamed protein product [Didymodactylos carnosus]|uniref:Aprataxin and PNK-like factor n=1 Tax=Didymodactylos carnosus TaxID=1234261 RepID=A0A8S2I8Z3_9BILA|nr:unnamed protein product [Didymodactylos carnosus]CAF3731382.1 unnamed protein product [Didymodactylos carnosus]